MLSSHIIGGISKGGTTSVFRYLAAHPEVCASSIKEVRFFALNERIEEGKLAEYHAYYSHCPSTVEVRVEASPAYLYGGAAVVERIYELLPEVRLIFILRDPVERFASHFTYGQTKSRTIPENLDMNAFVSTYVEGGDLSALLAGKGDISLVAESIEAGLYEQHLGEFLKRFSGNQIYIAFYEQLASDPRSFMEELSRYLEIDPGFYRNFNFTVENKTRYARFPRLQRMAEQVNVTMEPLFNRYPSLRVRMRELYFRLNPEKKGAMPKLSEESRRLLGEYFARHNIHLAKTILRCRHANSTPSWVS